MLEGLLQSTWLCHSREEGTQSKQRATTLAIVDVFTVESAIGWKAFSSPQAPRGLPGVGKCALNPFVMVGRHNSGNRSTMVGDHYALFVVY